MIKVKQIDQNINLIQIKRKTKIQTIFIKPKNTLFI